jgi:hypothetical protein
MLTTFVDLSHGANLPVFLCSLRVRTYNIFIAFVPPLSVNKSGSRKIKLACTIQHNASYRIILTSPYHHI